MTGDQIDTALLKGQRLDEAEGGHGFGLPISLELSELHGGSLELRRGDDPDLSGVTALVRLPSAITRMPGPAMEGRGPGPQLSIAGFLHRTATGRWSGSRWSDGLASLFWRPPNDRRRQRSSPVRFVNRDARTSSPFGPYWHADDHDVLSSALRYASGAILCLEAKRKDLDRRRVAVARDGRTAGKRNGLAKRLGEGCDQSNGNRTALS